MKRAIFVCILSLALNVNSAKADPYVGVIVEGFDADCTIQSKDHTSACKDQRHLYAGDYLITSSMTTNLKIKWAPYAGIRKAVGKAAYEVYFNPPKDKSLYNKIFEFMGFVKAEHRMVLGSTRTLGIEEKRRFPDTTMLLLHSEVQIYLPQGADSLSIHDTHGQLVWSGKGGVDRTVSFKPSELGLKHEGRYIIKVGTTRRYFADFRLISSSNQAHIDSIYSLIDNSTESNNEKLIRKAASLQMYSEYYPSDFDLYYNSSLLLEKVDKAGLDDVQKTLVERLADNCAIKLVN